MEVVSKLIKECGKELAVWNRSSFGYVHEKLAAARKRLEDLQQLNALCSDSERVDEARGEVNVWLEMEEVKWKQRSLVQWLKDGDQNTRFFHSQASQRRKRNMIRSLKDETGVWLEGEERDSLVTNFFKDLFASSLQSG
ncbi:hypothetical protein F2P56_033062 [Juglans regia]|uniref:Uncharacterized protein n=2 Tax=Juglans regia TaxID=51240 RepID=A0A833SU48_JUGRE|nr:uncharacterized protein LOC108985840 [Juglans regia]KAF5447511.1 hypothetical protein F2P56_033062 [Juglans regia]